MRYSAIIRRGVVLTGILLPVIFINGCATYMTGPTQRVPIQSYPDGANVRTDSGLRGVTPCSLDLNRSCNHIIEIYKDGYKTAQITLKKVMSGALAGNVLLGGVIGLGVDSATGACYKLIPENVSVQLEPGDENQIVIIKLNK